ncbi:MAG: MMPL family transporter [Gammaproteobacteria bacterium]|nr:MMPL family transporter [Gammaproteobacteria bacterium]
MIERWVIERLARWVSWVAGHAWITLILLSVATMALSWVAVDRFQMSSNLKELIRQDTPWRDDFDRFQDAFPDYVKTAVMVVSGTAFKQVEDTARRLEAEIRSRPDRFRAVYAGENHPFFRDHALLYLDEDELDDMFDRLAEAQPWLTGVAEDPSLRNMLDLVADGVENDPPSGFDTIVEWLETSARAAVAGTDPTVYWTNEIFGTDETHYRLILLKSNLAIRETAANAAVMQELREILAVVDPPPEVSVGITGEVALTHEEIEAAVGGLEMTGLLAIGLLVLVLVVGVRSIIIILATFAMLGMGMAWTSAFAMLTVGEYNTLSIVFLVMFFGLGVDFAIHFSLRYQEAVGAGLASIERALTAATRSVGGAIFICTVTTALGFLGFWPTDYRGLADLGVISAGGMVIAGFLTFTLLPAFYTVCRPVNPHTMDVPTSERLVGHLISHRARVVISMSVLVCGGIAVASLSRFDYSVLALKDPESESMRTLRTLQEDGRATDYALSILSDEPIETARLKDLPVVDSVVSLANFVPDDQDYKLLALEDLQEILWSAIEPLRQLDEPSLDDLQQSVRHLVQAIDEYDADGRFAGLREALAALESVPPERLLTWQRGVIDNLVEELEWMRRAVLVGPVEDTDLPWEVRERMVNAEGKHLTIVLPAENVAPVDALSRFIEGVREEAPLATGRPVIEWGIGEIVMDSFIQAMIFALASIGLVLVLMFQSFRYAVLILVPLAMAVIFTLALGVVFKTPLNMANILVLPLIFGLGVDNGVHVVDRYRGEGDVPRLMHSSTPRAVLLSTLTTVGTFVALSFSPHQGTASIGLLLAVAVSLLLLFTVFLLPVLLSWVSEKAA